eukprot:1081227-Pelagomonas_calceolata.AAC.1
MKSRRRGALIGGAELKVIVDSACHTKTKMMCKISLLFLFGFLELRFLSLVLVLACWAVAASRVEKGWAGRPGMEGTKIASRWLWCQAEEPVPRRKNHLGRVRETFQELLCPAPGVSLFGWHPYQ